MALNSNQASISLREAHMQVMLETNPSLPYIEVLAENFFAMRGPHYSLLKQLAERYPVMLHCVGLSIGSGEPVDPSYLQRVRALADDLHALNVSDHLSASAVPGSFIHDLLPIRYRQQALPQIIDNVRQVQDGLNVPFLVENVSRYLAYADEQMSEGALMTELVAATDVGILLDVNNLYVTGHNLMQNPETMLFEYPLAAVQQYHLAGHQVRPPLLVDTHGCTVDDKVWQLYRQCVNDIGARPTIIEWDNDIPELDLLLSEARAATTILAGKVAA